MIILLVALASTGCKGRSIKEENPVFTAAPPRRSLVNHSADAEEQRLTQQRPEADGVTQVGYSRLSKEGPLSGTSVVAEVNGKPVFVDDVLGGARYIIENDTRLPDEQRQAVLESELRKRLPKYVEDQLIIHALEQKIPEDKRKLIGDSLEPRFQELLEDIKTKEGFVTDQQLNDRLATENTSIDQLRDNFTRMQMVEGFVSTLCSVPETIDRDELVRYYQDHVDDYTPDEEVRFAEIVVRFRDHGGIEGAEKVMTTVVTQLQNGEDFGDVAQAMSDTLTAEKRGEVGWIKRDALSDKALEAMLFEMPVGQMSSVQAREDRFEVFKVIDHRAPTTTPFQEVQQKIEENLLAHRRHEARAKVREDIRKKGIVETIFDGEPAIAKPQ